MTTIGKSLSIAGEFSSNEDVTIHGHVNGKIAMKTGTLVLSPTANVQAEAHVGKVNIQGTFSGDLVASERVEITSTAQVTGTVIGPALVVHDGAVFNGKMEVNRGPKAAKSAGAA